MKEDFLHYVWRTKNFAQTDLRTTDGREIQVLDFGQLNHEGGPDFKGCRVKVDGMLWAGSVEMHLVASYWEEHGHSSDPAYENVILHVVLEEDQPVYIHGSRLPCIELRGRIPGDLLARYQKLMRIQGPVPCANSLGKVSDIVRVSWLQRMAAERLQNKGAYFRTLAQRFNNDWEQVFYVALARGFGFKSNADAMERMALAVPVRYIRASSGEHDEIEALFFGAAGMLNRIFTDRYAVDLQRKFDHLCRRHAINPIDARCWQWGRLRPPNLPPVRISQFADLICNNFNLVSNFLEAGDTDAMRKILNCQVSEYWRTHTDFDRLSQERGKSLGRGSADRILINTVIPFLFIYGTYRGDDRLRNRALELLMEISNEDNRITRLWQQIGLPNRHAGDSQGLLHLKREYCEAFRCTECAIGHEILHNPGPAYGR